jgi:hypothetical protein
MPAMSRAKAYDESGNQISKGEIRNLGNMMKFALINEYEGATSEKGLAADRNILAKTAKAIARNSSQGHWSITDAGMKELKAIFGEKLDGKGGEIGALVQHIRNVVRAPESTGYSYWG